LAALDNGGGRVVEAKTPEARRAAIAADYGPSPQGIRARTLVIDPSREGRDALTAEIRKVLIEKGQLGERAVLMETLVGKRFDQGRSAAGWQRMRLAMW